MRVLIAAADHGFCDGAAYERQDPFRHSPFDTSVFILQTAKAARKWPTGPSFETELRAAFRDCLPSAAAVGRQLKRDGGALPRTGTRTGRTTKGDSTGAGRSTGGPPTARKRKRGAANGEGVGAGAEGAHEAHGEGEGGGTEAAGATSSLHSRRERKKQRKGPRMSPKIRGRHDAATEAELDKWVAAKRKGDWAAADAIRATLATQGITADKERPAKPKPKTAVEAAQ